MWLERATERMMNSWVYGILYWSGKRTQTVLCLCVSIQFFYFFFLWSNLEDRSSEALRSPKRQKRRASELQVDSCFVPWLRRTLLIEILAFITSSRKTTFKNSAQNDWNVFVDTKFIVRVWKLNSVNDNVLNVEFIFTILPACSNVLIHIVKGRYHCDVFIV